MVIAATCPVHGPFKSSAIQIENSIDVSLTGNIESCPVPDCGLPSRIMDGNFSFNENNTVVHSAPEWSVRALSTVQEALADAVRIASDPNAPIKDAKRAFEKAAALTRVNSQDTPPSLRSQILELLSLNPVLKVKGVKRKILVIGIILHFLLGNYTTYKSNAIELTNDLGPAVEWITENVELLSPEFQAEIERAFRELQTP